MQGGAIINFPPISEQMAELDQVIWEWVRLMKSRPITSPAIQMMLGEVIVMYQNLRQEQEKPGANAEQVSNMVGYLQGVLSAIKTIDSEGTVGVIRL